MSPHHPTTIAPRAPETNPPAHALCRAGFTLIDLLVTLSVLLVCAVIAFPSMSSSDRTRLVGAANLLLSDLEFARASSIATPGDPALLRFDTDETGYWVARLSAPNDPIDRDGLGNPYEVYYSEGLATDLYGVTVAVVDAGDEGGTILFDAFGRLSPVEDVTVTISNGAGELSILVDAWTGDASLVE